MDVIGSSDHQRSRSDLAKALCANLRLRDLRAAVVELPGYLAEGVTEEATVQCWYRRHGWAFGISYQKPDDARDIAVGDTVDFLLPTLVGYRDLVEPKRLVMGRPRDRHAGHPSTPAVLDGKLAAAVSA